MSDFHALSEVLAEEYRCLQAGRLTDLPGLTTRKEAMLIRILGAAALEVAQLAPLLSQARANHLMLDATMKGIRSALTRIEAIRTVGSGLTAYNAQGRTIRHQHGVSVIERRA